MRLLKTFKIWLPIAVGTTLVYGIIYLVVQQNYRISANDPQIQIAEDVAGDISSGLSPDTIVLNRKVNIDSSLSPFVILFDQSGNPINGSGVLKGQTPKLPIGVFDFARTHGQNRLTWEPAKGVRIAAVIQPYAGSKPGFILAGKSLREVEIREGLLGTQVLAGWVFTMLATLVSVMLFEVPVLSKLNLKKINIKRLKIKKS